ncbi:MAG: hypothetical protein ACLFM8_02550 [Halobacteriales archaeon]
MAAETAVIGFLILLRLLLAWTIGLGGAVGLIAGYQQGDLPPDREQRLVRRVQVALLAVAITYTLPVVDTWTGVVPYAWWIAGGVTVVDLVALLVIEP